MPLSAAPLRACIPISAVPPSPAKARTVISSAKPLSSNDAKIPDADAPVVANGVW
ncbi:hypothetical protein ES705_27858 [subsurface metagenome]